MARIHPTDRISGNIYNGTARIAQVHNLTIPELQVFLQRSIPEQWRLTLYNRTQQRDISTIGEYISICNDPLLTDPIALIAAHLSHLAGKILYNKLKSEAFNVISVWAGLMYRQLYTNTVPMLCPAEDERLHIKAEIWVTERLSIEYDYNLYM